MANDQRAARAAAYENPRPEVQRHVPATAKRILDLGCASGVVGAELKARQQAEVVGIESDPVYVGRAAARLDRVVHADLEQMASRPDLDRELGAFDCLIAADVLEHLRDPWSTLHSFVGLLEPAGTAVLSLPNVRFWETFWLLGVRGVWPRRSEGIFDRDHLRWFTAADGIALLESAGLRFEEIERIYRARPVISRWDRPAARLAATPLRPFFTFQFLLVGRRR